MIWFVSKSARWWSPRAIISLLALGAYLITILGIPLPVAAKKNGDDTPYPCQDHPCGCLSAVECWKSCCCFSPEERLAWAKRNHVTPPSYAVLSSPPSPSGWNDRPAKACENCSDQESGSLEARDCQSRTCSHDHEPAPKPKRIYSGFMALKCKSLATLWVMTGACTMPPQPFTLAVFFLPLHYLSLDSLSASSRSEKPVLPPPRILV